MHGILPGALSYNKKGVYIDRWVDLQTTSEANNPWLRGIKKTRPNDHSVGRVSLPIANGEGRFVVDEKEYKNLVKNNQIAFKYVKGEIAKFQNLEHNPNGSDYDIAGVLSSNGRVLGLMPHPERAMFFYQSPLWQTKKQDLKRKEGLPAGAKAKEGAGLQIFRNAVDYFSSGGGSALGGK